MAFVVTPILVLLGIVGQIVYGVVIVVGLAWGLRLRLKQMNTRTEEFWRSGPDD